MSPETLALLIQGISAAIKAAPMAVALAVKAKDFVASLVHHGIISVEQQDKINAHFDELSAAVESGTPPPEFTVEANPS